MTRAVYNSIVEYEQKFSRLEAENETLKAKAELVDELIHLAEELNKRYLEETKRPFLWYKGYAVEGFLEKSKALTGKGK